MSSPLAIADSIFSAATNASDTFTDHMEAPNEDHDESSGVEMDSDGQSGAPPSLKQLDRSQRALCRILVNGHKVTRVDIARYCHWDRKLVGKAARIGYFPDDVEANDEEELQRRPELVEIKTQLIKLHQEAYPNKTRTVTTRSATERTSSAPSSKASSSSKTVTSAHNYARTATRKRYKFLDCFVKKSTLDATYYDLFIAAGLTEESLRRMAGHDAPFLIRFFEALIPQSSGVDRALFATAVRDLAE
ncbi:hypothetical protein B0H15DRAFT_540339 [Mycena belliarum]|uniref:Uncharacterized protein n=1 Tax=Mycena belliarum TaxID=1033014 RepID=A0AAD6TTT3_9AGAR|nr:hypothetical protein B0H15DRAFT_540339 [Mycena belliae]